MNAVSPHPVDKALLEEAADWIMTFRFSQPSELEKQAFERWRAQSPAHVDAWTRAQSVMGAFEAMPAKIGRDTLQALKRTNRRQAIRTLSMLMIAAPVGWLAYRQLPWEQWTADVTTARGESRAMVLADGTRLVLNTASAVDIAFTATERRILLRAGEILVTTAKDPAPTYRPLLVQTPQGVVQALGTRFSVRRLDELTHVAVFEHAVEIRPEHGTPLTLQAGQQTLFGRRQVEPVKPVEPGATLWEQGMLVARNMRLADVVSELGRYRSGILRCHPDVAELRLSGSISLADTDAGLAALAATLPVRISRVNRYWVSVNPI